MNDVAFWITSGERKFFDEAVWSALTMAEHMPDIPRVMCTPDDRDHDVFDEIIHLPPCEHPEMWYLDSIRYFRIANEAFRNYDRMLYLDSDTIVLQPFPEVFDMLERFDVVGIMGSRRITGATFKQLPQSFPEFEIGVTGFRRGDVIDRLLQQWLELHTAHPEIYGNNDQRSFREALWNIRELQIGTMPSEYGCRWPFGVFVSLPVKILHGRSCNTPGHPTNDDVARIINEHYEMRIWSPRTPNWNEGVIPPVNWKEE